MSELPVLYHLGKQGALYTWRVWVEGDEIVTEYGLFAGRKQIARRRAVAKNVGRSNATTAEEQAEAEARSMHRFRIERRYSASPEQAREPLLLPMLAQDFARRKARLAGAYPVYVQPKLDGLRALARLESGEVEILSRSGKRFHLPHLEESLRAVLGAAAGEPILDGELYLHGRSFQEITSMVRRHQPGRTERLEYHLYDVVEPTAEEAFELRLRRLAALADTVATRLAPGLAVVPTTLAASEAEVYGLNQEHLRAGYEGSVVRLRHGLYRFGFRSAELLKLKSFLDAEFPVVGFSRGVGRFSDTVIWECETRDGKRFSVVPSGSMAERKALLSEAGSHLGELLKVKFYSYTDEGLPRFPVAIGFRLPEDTG